jgi:DNA ligase (NAD+)
LLTQNTLSDYNKTSVAAEEVITRLGDTIASGVSKSPTYPIVGENPRSKLAKAQRVGVAIHSKQWLIDLCKQYETPEQ